LYKSKYNIELINYTIHSIITSNASSVNDP